LLQNTTNSTSVLCNHPPTSLEVSVNVVGISNLIEATFSQFYLSQERRFAKSFSI